MIDLSLIQDGDVLNCEGSGIIAKGISLFTGSKTTHTALAVRIEKFDNRLFIIDAQINGVFPRPFEVWLKKYEYNFTVRRKPNSDKQFIDNVVKRISSQIGAGYDYGLFLGEAPEEIIKEKLGLKSEISDKFKGNGKFICSELIQWSYMVEDAHKFTPKMVQQYHNEKNWHTILQRRV